VMIEEKQKERKRERSPHRGMARKEGIAEEKRSPERNSKKKRKKKKNHVLEGFRGLRGKGEPRTSNNT